MRRRRPHTAFYTASATHRSMRADPESETAAAPFK
jgi:hypothetical protein